MNRYRPDPPSSAHQAQSQRARWDVAAYATAIVGGAGIAPALYPVRSAVQPATVALSLVVVVLIAATLGGRQPAWVGAALGFVSFNLFHTRPYLRLAINDVEHLELALVFALVAVLVGEIAVQGRYAREAILRTEFREARLRRVLASAAAGVEGDRLVRMIEHEVVDELQLHMARYEPRPRTTCHYHIDDHGQLHRRALPIGGERVRMPAEPIAVRVHAGTQDLGQLVLLPDRAHVVTDQQLILAADLAALLAGLLHRSEGPSETDRT